MKRITKSFLLSIVFMFLFGSVVSAQDSDTAGRTIGGTYVSYSHFLSYTDVRCGVNTQAHYHVDGRSAMDSIGVDWSVYSVFSGGEVDAGALSYSNRGTLRDNSDNRLPIEYSRARYSMSESGSSWSPTSTVYHCESWLATNGETEENSDKEKLKNAYYDIKQNENGLSSNDKLNNDLKEIMKNQLTDNSTNVNEYQFKDGTQVSLNDFEIVSVEAENSSKPVADDVTFNNPDQNNTTIIELEIDKPVYKNDEEYKITGYVVFIDNEQQNLESGIYVDLVK